MAEPVVDDRYFPLVVNVIPEHLLMEHLPAFHAKTEAILKRREPYVTITDLTAARHLPSPVARKALADWSERFEPELRRLALGSAIVIDSALIRGGLTALFWLAPPPYPQQVVATKLEAIEVVRRYYEASGRTVPESFSLYRTELEVLARRAAR
jgi:hypothetical protein